MCNIYSNTPTLFYVSGPFGLAMMSCSGSLNFELDAGSADLSWSLFIKLVLNDNLRHRLHSEKNSYKWLRVKSGITPRVGESWRNWLASSLLLFLFFPLIFFVSAVSRLSEMVTVVLSHVFCVQGSGYSPCSCPAIWRVFGDAWSQFWQFTLGEVALTAVATQC